MKRNCMVLTTFLPILLLSACGGEAPQAGSQDKAEPNDAQHTACDFLSKEEFQAITGIAVVNVKSNDYGVYSSCSYEAEDWMNTSGVLYYPSVGTFANSAALADFLRQDLEKDEAPYKTPEPVEGLGDAAAYYVDEEGYMHFVAVQKGGERIVASAKSKDAAMKLAEKALASF